MFRQHMYSMKSLVLTVLILTIILGIEFEPAPLYAEGIKESAVEPGKPIIGIVHITFEPTFFFETVQYQSFDLSYRRQWERLAEQYDFNLIQVEGGVAFDTMEIAVQRLIDLEVDAILLFQHEPSAIAASVKLAQKAGIPIAVHGIRPLGDVAVPYIGFAEYKTCYELGKQLAQYFSENNPGKQAKVIILNARTVISDVERERGFTDGFKSVLPGTVFFDELEDTGSAQSVRDVLLADLLRNEGINVIFATNDLRAQAARSTLGMLPAEQTESIILAGVGGSGFAMRAILDSENPWKAEVGLNIREVAEKSYDVLVKMVNIKGSMKNGEEFLVPSYIFVNPSLDQVKKYIEENHGYEFKP